MEKTAGKQRSRKVSLTTGTVNRWATWSFPLTWKKNVRLWSRWQTEAIWKQKGFRTALEEDVITCFTYAAVKAAERKDAARCQVEPAGEAA